jgi:aminocarboxymuconate-semialdehyde decarboxylase
MRIDVHAHYFPREYVETIGRLLGAEHVRPALSAPGANLGVSERLALMDSAGIDLQVLSASLLQPYGADPAASAAAARFGNDLYAELCQRHPERFVALGAVPLPHVDAAIAEAARCLDTLGFRGITTGCSVAGRPLDDPAFEPFWAELDRRGALLFLHPMGIGFGDELAAYGLTWMIGALFEDTVATLRLVLGGVTTRYPRIRVLVPHLGGTLPFMMGRIGRATAAERERTGRPPLYFEGSLRENLRHCWYDTVNLEPAALRCACDVLGYERLVLGTDFPFLVDERFRECVRYIEAAGLPAEQVRAILGDTAQALLGL